MGRRVLAVLISMVIVVCALKSDVIGVYAADLDSIYEENVGAEDALTKDVETETIVSTDETASEEIKVSEETETVDETDIGAIVSGDVSAGDVPVADVSSDDASGNDYAVSEDVSAGDVSAGETIPEETQTEPDTADFESAESHESVAFFTIQAIGDVNICIEAPEGVFPAGSFASVKELTDAATVDSIESAVEESLSDGQVLTGIRAFDITVYGPDGAEVQPDTSKGLVKVSIRNIDTSEAISDSSVNIEVFHVEDSLTDVNAVGSTVAEGEVSFEASHFSAYVVASVEDKEADDSVVIDENALLKSVTVEVTDSNNITTVLSESFDNIVSLEDQIKVTYTFNEPLNINMPGAKINTKIDGYHVVAGQHYNLPPIPAICNRPSGYEIDVKSEDKVLGKLRIDAEGKAVLEISTDFEEAQSAFGAYAGFELSLNLNKEDNGDVDRYELVFGTHTYTIRVKDFMPQPPKVSKSVSSLDSDGNLTWTVTLTNDEKPIEYAGGFSLKDTFSEGQDYVEGSMQIVGGEAITPEVSGNTLTWTYEDNTPSKVTKFQYKTHIDMVALTKDSNVNDTVSKGMSNKIEVKAPGTDDYDALAISATATGSASKEVSKWVDKTGTDVDDNGKATWTIVVRNNGFKFKNVVLHDKIVADRGVNIDMNIVSVTDSHGNPVDYTPSMEDGVHNIAFTQDMDGDAVYTVIYETSIQDFAKYLKENHTVPNNSAWLTYEYDATGKGEWTPVKGPGVDTDFTGKGMLAKAAIKKSSAGIDRVHHTMDWRIDVNGNLQALTGVTITDAIPSGQSFVEIKNVTIGDAAASTDDYTVDTTDPANIKISFGDNIDGKKASFVITTKLNDNKSNIWAGNATANFTNNVTLESYGNEDVSDQATQQYVSEVIKKTAGSYNYSTHIIPYTITVNQNKMEMNNVVVTDPLDSRLEYVDGSSNVASTVYNSALNTLTFSFDTLSDETVIKFNVKVKDGETFEKNGKINITNEVGITSAEYSTSTKVSAKTVIDNKVIGKKGVRNKEVIDYTIELNVASQNLYRSGIGEVVIQDTIGASLVLDESSVKLYEATVNPNGSLTQGAQVTDAVVRVDHSGERSVLEVVVPKNGSNKAYILKYTTKMLKAKAKDYSNSVILKGYGDVNSNRSVVEYKEKDFANVDFSKYVYYISELVDSEDPLNIIPGAHFELIDPSKGNMVVDEADSDEDGEIMFVGVLEENHEYILKETEAPDGYEIPKDLKDGITVHTKGKGYAAAVAEKENNKIYNGKPTTNPGGGGGGSSTVVKAAATVKQKTIESLSDDSALDGKKLAKTGGFMGTLAGYGVGILLMIAGFFMVSGSKKKQR